MDGLVKSRAFVVSDHEECTEICLLHQEDPVCTAWRIQSMCLLYEPAEASSESMTKFLLAPSMKLQRTEHACADGVQFSVWPVEVQLGRRL